MNSRQRVLAAIEHKVPDRMPIDLGMHTSTGISVFAYDALRKYLGVSERDPVRIRDCVQLTAYVEEDVLRRFRCDCIALCPLPPDTHIWSPRKGYDFTVTAAFQPELNENGEWIARWNGQSMRMPAGGYFFDGAWLTFEDRWSEGSLRAFGLEAERIYKETEYFTALTGLNALFGSSIDDFCAMYTNPNEVRDGCQNALDEGLLLVDRIFDHCGEYIQMVCMSGDLGMQSAPFCSPELFGDLIAPYLKRLCGYIHDNTGYKVFLHSCGAVEPFIDIFIDCGIDVLNPVQITAAGMEPAALKRKHGDKITFWGGGVDTQGVLGQKGADAVRENVRELVGVFKPGGGYIFNPVHNILGDVPPENVAAAYDEAYKLSAY